MPKAPQFTIGVVERDRPCDPVLAPGLPPFFLFLFFWLGPDLPSATRLSVGSPSLVSGLRGEDGSKLADTGGWFCRGRLKVEGNPADDLGAAINVTAGEFCSAVHGLWYTAPGDTERNAGRANGCSTNVVSRSYPSPCTNACTFERSSATT